MGDEGVRPTGEQGWAAWQGTDGRWRWAAWCRGRVKDGAMPTPGEAGGAGREAWEELHGDASAETAE